MVSTQTADTQALVAQAPDAVIFAGLDGNVVTWNEAATRIFGFTQEQAVGANLEFIIPEKFREAHWTGYDRALEAGVSKYTGQSLPTRALHADGHEFYVELSFAIVKDETGTVVGALAHARDITERFERDRDTRRRIRELEQELQGYRSGQPPAASPAS